MPPSPSPTVSDLDAHLGFHLRAVSNHVSQAFAGKLAGQGVTTAEWVVLRALYGAPPTAPSQLAARLGLTRGAITKLADRLIAKAFLTRTASPEDGRAQTLALTPAGTALVPDLAALADRNDADCFGVLDATERATLKALLARIAAHCRITAAPVE
ncbi:winged helix-turn-helix transcriptional regulator [Aquabacter sp. L1I39]|uniref:MarR family winged helix-turn-helix transcriptional regulator n=1 Tax=Aquabacter sp. L1I39 TaxID=2820278 RepID=UPI001ADBEF3E|nr:MarR family winged helix-turn-helix transcriptional regulator [Aquabacter sp. L1I39]QTL03578.1 winged helix-turn-helix transcriptional regulator [Aquabacter sp. L1I39]